MNYTENCRSVTRRRGITEHPPAVDIGYIKMLTMHSISCELELKAQTFCYKSNENQTCLLSCCNMKSYRQSRVSPASGGRCTCSVNHFLTIPWSLSRFTFEFDHCGDAAAQLWPFWLDRANILEKNNRAIIILSEQTCLKMLPICLTA